MDEQNFECDRKMCSRHLSSGTICLIERPQGGMHAQVAILSNAIQAALVDRVDQFKLQRSSRSPDSNFASPVLLLHHGRDFEQR